jgi:hypothetical protein
MSTETDIFQNIKEIYRRMSRAAMKADRNPADVTLIAVTKTVETAAIREAVDAGLRVFGESRIQEAQRKVNSEELKVNGKNIEWHLIGHLQRNKAKTAVALFDLIHSLDSIDLALEISRQAEKIGKVQEVLIEVKLSAEETKHGISKDDLPDLAAAINAMTNLRLRGLMTVPPFFEDPEEARPCFRELRELKERLEDRGFLLPELSMGMSHDFETAIEEGATMVRVGTAIFGTRK